MIRKRGLVSHLGGNYSSDNIIYTLHSWSNKHQPIRRLTFHLKQCTVQPAITSDLCWEKQTKTTYTVIGNQEFKWNPYLVVKLSYRFGCGMR